jgi:hypothetical protein
MKRMFGVALTWAALWLVAWSGIFGVIAVVDPDSIDPGDVEGMAAILGSMGLLAGIAFALLATRAERDTEPAGWPLVRTVAWGLAGTALVQILYLNHGDAGLAANLVMALLLCGLGGVVTLAWLLLARGVRTISLARARRV